MTKLLFLVICLMVVWTRASFVATVDPMVQEKAVNVATDGTTQLWNNHANNQTDTRMVIHIPFKYHNKAGEDHEVARWGGANTGWYGTLAEFVYYYDRPL